MKQTWHRVYVGIGSNLGPRRKNIDLALSYLKQEKAIKIAKISPLYNTKPVGGPKQPEFLNGVLYLRTTVAASGLLEILKTVEKRLGRKANNPKWEPRKMDLDILFYDDFVVNTKKLVIPHPLMHKRGFVLVPLVEIAPYVRHPVLKKTVKRLFNDLKQGL